MVKVFKAVFHELNISDQYPYIISQYIQLIWNWYDNFLPWRFPSSAQSEKQEQFKKGPL